jgi:hypothetical protein
MNHDVPSRRDLRPIPPKNFSDPPADPIAHHRASQRLLHADTETALRCAIGAVKNNELRRALSPAAPVNRFELGAAYKSRGAG